MGADTGGWVELKKPNDELERWRGIIDIENLVHRSYGMFAGLFGFRDGAGYGFEPIAPRRGAPPDGSHEYVSGRNYCGVAAWESWVLQSELEHVDWDEEGEGFWDEEGYLTHDPRPGRKAIRRGDFRAGGWAALLDVMEVLGRHFGADNVRLSVWFDME